MCDQSTTWYTNDSSSSVTRRVADVVDDGSKLIPLSTSSFKKEYQEQRYDFPNLYINHHVPLWNRQDPMSTRVYIQNQLLMQRHFNK